MKAIAIVVGIDAYRDQPLTSAVHDALAFKDALLRLDLVDAGSVWLLTAPAQDGGPPATRDEITAALRHPYLHGDDIDRMFVFFSGHGSLKARLGRLAYVWTGMRKLGDEAVPVRVRVDDADWFDGTATCVLLGNVGRITGGIPAFPDARPDDGRLDVGVSTAEGALQWARTLGRMVTGQARRSPFVRTTRARTVDVTLGAPLVYELDGGARKKTTRMRVRAVPQAITVCVPEPAR